jgi:hypothetical protein
VIDITRRKSARSGKFIMTPKVPFTQNQLEGPIIVQQLSGPIIDRGKYGDDAEMDQIECSGRIVGPKSLEVRWVSRGLVRGEYKFVYMAPYV